MWFGSASWDQALAGLFGLTGEFGLTGDLGLTGDVALTGLAGVFALTGLAGLTAVFGVFGVFAVFGAFAVFGGTAFGSTAGSTPAVASAASEPDCTVVTTLEPCWGEETSNPLANAATGDSATAAAPPAKIHFVLFNIVITPCQLGSAPFAADKNKKTNRG